MTIKTTLWSMMVCIGFCIRIRDSSVDFSRSWCPIRRIWRIQLRRPVNAERRSVGRIHDRYERNCTRDAPVPVDWVPVSLDTSRTGRQSDWTPVVLVTDWTGYQSYWLPVELGTSRAGTSGTGIPSKDCTVSQSDWVSHYLSKMKINSFGRSLDSR